MTKLFNQKKSSLQCFGIKSASEESFPLLPELALGFIPLIADAGKL